jgi:hypothetical protein
MRTRDDSDEAYVVGLCSQVLGETALTQHKFDGTRMDSRSASCAIPALISSVVNRLGAACGCQLTSPIAVPWTRRSTGSP